LHANPPDQAIEERFKKLSAEMQLMIQAMDLLVSELKDLEKNHQGVASHNKDLLSNYKTVVGEFQDINSIDHQQRMRQKIKREHRKYSNLQVNVIVANKILKSLTDLNRKLPELKQQFESVIKAKSTESLRSA
jgi:sugar-specific transcriptional regulator TrmB